jgi:methenyltetrahydromethanopterin cyclohydrolase
MDSASWPSVGRTVQPELTRLLEEAGALRLGVEHGPGGALLVDAGIDRPGGIEAGLRIALICMGGLGRVGLAGGSPFPSAPFCLTVRTAMPVLACLGSQYAGWSLSHGKGKEAWLGMASGPGRARAAKEPLFEELRYRDDASRACFVLETDRVPPAGLIDQVARDCGLPASALTFILTPTSSLAGTAQIVSRVLEVALHKAHALGFPLEQIVDGLGRAPLPPPAPDFLGAMGRTNDAVLFGGEVQLFVAGPEAEAAKLARDLPSSASKDYGRPFKELFQEAGGDFYKIDPMLFSPARVLVTALDSGRSFEGGGLAPELIARSFAA